MTKNIANVNVSTDTFGDFIGKLNQVIESVRNIVITTNAPATGNAVVNGTIQTDTFFADTIRGGSISSPGLLTISSNTTVNGQVLTITSNTTFSGVSNLYLGAMSSITILGANATNYLLASNASTGKLYFVSPSITTSMSALTDTSIGNPANNSFLLYSTTNSRWVNKTTSEVVSLLAANLAVLNSNGILFDTNLPTRIRSYANTITDWNNAVENGWFKGVNATNAPLGSFEFVGQVIAANATFITQEVTAHAIDGSANTATYRRSRNTGVWTTWYRIYDSQIEIENIVDNRVSGAYLSLSTGGNVNANVSLASTINVYSNGAVSGAGILTDTLLSTNFKIPSSGLVKSYVDNEVSNIIGMYPDFGTFGFSVGEIETKNDFYAAIPEVLRNNASSVINNGFAANAYNAGTFTSGTFIPNYVNGNFQYVTNNGAHTLNPPTASCSMVILYTNGASAGAIVTSAFSKVLGDAFTTSVGDIFICNIIKVGNTSILSVINAS